MQPRTILLLSWSAILVVCVIIFCIYMWHYKRTKKQGQSPGADGQQGQEGHPKGQKDSGFNLKPNQNHRERPQEQSLPGSGQFYQKNRARIESIELDLDADDEQSTNLGSTYTNSHSAASAQVDELDIEAEIERYRNLMKLLKDPDNDPFWRRANMDMMDNNVGQLYGATGQTFLYVDNWLKKSSSYYN